MWRDEWLLWRDEWLWLLWLKIFEWRESGALFGSELEGVLVGAFEATAMPAVSA